MRKTGWFKEDNERLKAKIAAKNKQTEGDMETKDTFAKQLNEQENEILKLKKEKEDLEKKMKTKEEEFEQMRQTLQSERKTKDEELEQMRQTLQSESNEQKKWSIETEEREGRP
ncbi:coiled-coil domain-containing protein 34-like isoform X2 [Argopecten irradians]|uniref:coiled-coil domain-containing protein 34-like isoform X2 n=1 Tax=Argopecten irradians TaxID=31199 RepID=UPI00371A9C1C